MTPHDLAQAIVRANDPSSPRCGKPAVNLACEPTGPCVRCEGHDDFCTASASEAAQEDRFFARSVAKEGAVALAQALLDAQARLDRMARIEGALENWLKLPRAQQEWAACEVEDVCDRYRGFVATEGNSRHAEVWKIAVMALTALAALARSVSAVETGRERFARIVKAIGPLEATVLASAEIPPEWRKDEKDGADDE